MRYSKRLALTAELHWFALCAVCTRKGCSSILILFISFCADARNVSKTALDACIYISEPPQRPPKLKGGQKKFGLKPRCGGERRVKASQVTLGRRPQTAEFNEQRATRRRAARAPRRRRNTRAQHASPAPPVRRLDEKRAQRVRRLAPLDVDGSVAPARRPRLAPAAAGRRVR